VTAAFFCATKFRCRAWNRRAPRAGCPRESAKFRTAKFLCNIALHHIGEAALGARAGAKRRFQPPLTTLTHGDDDGSVVGWRHAAIPSNPLAALCGVLAVTACLFILAGPARAQQYDCSDETYRRARPKVESLFGAGVLRKDTHSAGSVLVLDNYWAQLTAPEKRRFADRLVCAMAGAGKSLPGLTLKSLTTGKVLGEWAGGNLSVR
jgi:hypothetical protein